MRNCGLTIDRVSMPLDLERMLVEVNRRLKGNKALDPGRLQGRRVAALDGIEILSSQSRCGEFCLQRRVASLDARANRSSLSSTAIQRWAASSSVARSSPSWLSRAFIETRIPARL